MKQRMIFNIKQVLKHALSIGLSTSLFLITIHASATENSKASIDRLKISPQLWVFRVNTAKGNTNTLVYHDKSDTLLIDPNFNHTTALIKAQLDELNASNVTHISISHLHRDHTEQLADFIQPATQLFLSAEQYADLKTETEMLKNTQLVSRQTTLKINNNLIQLIKLPYLKGHTTGDLVFYFSAEQALYVGDYLFTHGYPIIDKNIGDINGYFNNLDYMTAQFPADTLVIPGHSSISPQPAETFTMSQFKQRISLLKQSVCYINQAKTKGLSLSSIQQQGLPQKFSALNQDAVFVKENKWIANVYQQTIKICENFE
ncbi:MBL fold metallo-hydrolase [Aliikangiella maris]|uniref:MBL fold metallo-hydrolase n=2 Tax=Aliikangiella maris TaxID=3162458 RepID=A0ABV2BPZ9_9GAMM